jgi:Rod binding domain-containing protein
MDIVNIYTSGLLAPGPPIISQNGKAAQTPTSSPSLADAKLRKAAAEFEGMLLSSLWKSMRFTFASPDSDESTDPAHDTLNDLSVQTMAGAVSKAGGLGLGKLILKHLEPILANSQPQNETNSSKGSTAFADIPK